MQSRFGRALSSCLFARAYTMAPTLVRVSARDTTRSPRPGEVNGKAYHFVTKAEFENLINEKGFAEYTTTYDTYVDRGRIVPTRHRHGRSGQYQKTPRLARMSLHLHLAPSLSSLGDRLRKRGTENEDTIVKRLAKAKSEIEYAASGAFDVIVVNDNVDRSYALLRSVIRDGVRTGDSLPDGILEETAVSIN
ncbi:Guanylate kinase-like protein [Rhizoctonia solani]|uniref:Guanylate kinase-like protein n=1 Tax=Rhizoctonia solani TaxID=456999 RepID=A0A8H7M4H2_9AGAM|nr:Guanylate kinase-like protein [Rhizoctonia solani]